VPLPTRAADAFLRAVLLSVVSLNGRTYCPLVLSRRIVAILRYRHSLLDVYRFTSTYLLTFASKMAHHPSEYFTSTSVTFTTLPRACSIVQMSVRTLARGLVLIPRASARRRNTLDVLRGRRRSFMFDFNDRDQRESEIAYRASRPCNAA